MRAPSLQHHHPHARLATVLGDLQGLGLQDLGVPAAQLCSCASVEEKLAGACGPGGNGPPWAKQAFLLQEE